MNIQRTEIMRCRDKFWAGLIIEDEGKYFTASEYWHITKNGESKHQQSVPVEVKSKNVGRANETSVEVQAQSELLTLVREKEKKGYCFPGESSEILPLAMGVKPLNLEKLPKFQSLSFQPKINGVKALFTNRAEPLMWSRSGIAFPPEIYAHLAEFNTVIDNVKYIVDGEFVLPAPYTFQQTLSAVKKYDPELTPKLYYIVYDVAEMNKPFLTRYEILQKLVNRTNCKSITLCTNINGRWEDFRPLHSSFVEAGWEGTIIRDNDGLYEFGKKSNSIYKYKDFVDSEYLIVDVKDGEGKFEGVIMFVCKAENGRTFDCSLKGYSLEERKEMFTHKDDYLGKMLTVRYQNLTDDGVPFFPRGINIRDYEVQGG